MSHLTLFHIFLAFCRIISFVIFHCDSRINNIWGVYMTLILGWYMEGSVELGWSWDVCCDSFPEYWWVSKLEFLERETAAFFFCLFFDVNEHIWRKLFFCFHLNFCFFGGEMVIKILNGSVFWFSLVYPEFLFVIFSIFCYFHFYKLVWI